jgi:hypothetical protein
VHRYLLIAAWPEEVKKKMRQYPEVFTTRVIFNQFVSRGFADEGKLRQAVEERVKASLAVTSAASSTKDSATPLNLSAESRQAVKVLSDKLQTGIKVKTVGGKGKLEISYQNEEELQRILQILSLT